MAVQQASETSPASAPDPGGAQPPATVSSSSSSSTICNTTSAKGGAEKGRQWHPLDQYREALEQFGQELLGKEKSQKSESDEGIGASSTSNTTSASSGNLVDEFLEMVAATGRPQLPWTVVGPAVVHKLESVMDSMHIREAESQPDDFAKEALINSAELRQTKEFIMDKARSFDGTPFTIQRICELLTAPTKHYHATGTFLRALEKNINVVTTVTENGMRITGADEQEEVAEPPIPVERNFIVSVDELDEPLPAKLAKAEQQQSANEPQKQSNDGEVKKEAIDVKQEGTTEEKPMETAD